MVANGADVNDANPDGFTALMYAARNGHYKTVEHLLGASRLFLQLELNLELSAASVACMREVSA